MSVLTDIHNTEPLILFKILFIYDGENNTLIIDATTATFSLLTRSKVELNAYYTPKNSPARGVITPFGFSSQSQPTAPSQITCLQAHSFWPPDTPGRVKQSPAFPCEAALQEESQSRREMRMWSVFKAFNTHSGAPVLACLPLLHAHTHAETTKKKTLTRFLGGWGGEVEKECKWTAGKSRVKSEKAHKDRRLLPGTRNSALTYLPMLPSSFMANDNIFPHF